MTCRRALTVPVILPTHDQEVVRVLEEWLAPLALAELSVLVDVLQHPDLLFPIGSEARRRCEAGGFICRLFPKDKDNTSSDARF